MSIRTLRWVGVIGLAFVLIVDLISSLRMKSGFGLGFVMLVLGPLFVGVLSFPLMPRAVGALIRWPDLLVPLALVTVAIRIVDWLSAAPGFGMVLSPTFPLKIYKTCFAISLRLVLIIALAAYYASWVTGAINEYVRQNRSDLSAEMLPALRRYWRILGAEVIGMGAVLLVTSVLILMMPALGFFVLLPMAVFALGWNFATAALLPVVCEGGRDFGQSVKAGFFASLTNLGKWWALVLVQMFLLGFIFVFYSSRAGNTNFSWSVNVFWTGGYEANSRWYGSLAAALQVGQLPIVQSLLALGFGALAVAVKIAVIQRLHGHPKPSD